METVSDDEHEPQRRPTNETITGALQAGDHELAQWISIGESQKTINLFGEAFGLLLEYLAHVDKTLESLTEITDDLNRQLTGLTSNTESPIDADALSKKIEELQKRLETVPKSGFTSEFGKATGIALGTSAGTTLSGILLLIANKLGVDLT